MLLIFTKIESAKFKLSRFLPNGHSIPAEPGVCFIRWRSVGKHFRRNGMGPPDHRVRKCFLYRALRGTKILFLPKYKNFGHKVLAFCIKSTATATWSWILNLHSTITSEGAKPPPRLSSYADSGSRIRWLWLWIWCEIKELFDKSSYILTKIKF